MTDFLAFMGVIFLIVLIMIAVACLYDVLEKVIKRAHRTWQYKRRFKKKPIAKCYCIDCINYDDNRELCRLYDLHFRNNEFCSYATPDMYKIPNIKESED